MAQVRIADPAGFFNGSTLVQFGTVGGTTLVQLMDGVTGDTGDGQYEVNFVSDELTVYGSGVSGPNIHVVKLTTGIPSGYDTRVLKLHTYLVVGGSIVGNRDIRTTGGIGNDNVLDGTLSASKIDATTFTTDASFAVSDLSSALLTITNNKIAHYIKFQRSVQFALDVTYPTTADASTALLSLPTAVLSAGGAICFFPASLALALPGSLTVPIYPVVDGSVTPQGLSFWYGINQRATNAMLSGARLVIAGTYIADS